MSKIFYSLTLITPPILSVLISSCGMSGFPGDGGDMEALQQQEEQAVLEDTSEMFQATELSVEPSHHALTMSSPAPSDRHSQNHTQSSELIAAKDPRPKTVLNHPSEDIQAYCYHSDGSECFIEGRYNGKSFKYDITPVEGGNIGKITNLFAEVESVKTTPIKWLNIDDNRVQVVMQTQIYRKGQRYTSHEDLIVDYDSGPFWR